MARTLVSTLALIGAAGAITVLAGCAIGGTPHGKPTSTHRTTTTSTRTSAGSSSDSADGDGNADAGTVHDGDSLFVTQSGDVDATCDGGGDLYINSVAGITLFVSGNCASVTIATDGNTVLLDSADALDVSGDGNTVTWTSGSPTVSDTGKGNSLSLDDGSTNAGGSSDGPDSSGPATTAPDSGAPTSPSSPATPGPSSTDDGIYIDEDGAVATETCTDGRDVFVSASNALITVTGQCGTLTVNGSSDSITIDTVDLISVFGDNSGVTYSTGAPTIEDYGVNNTIVQG
jgi:hypothetical protein